MEKNSAESEKKIAEARSEKMKQMSEMQQAQRRMGDMEQKLKNMETSLGRHLVKQKIKTDYKICFVFYSTKRVVRSLASRKGPIIENTVTKIFLY